MNLITDRTLTDVERYIALRDKGFANLADEERAEWLSPMKGAYNYTDLNRVEEAVEYVTGRLRECGYYPAIGEINKTWAMDNIPTLADMNRYLDNVKAIRSAFSVMETTPYAADSMNGLTYKEANDIEQILFDVDMLIDNMISAWFFNGDLYSGEV